MFIVNSYSLAVVFCFITMMCWGSWGNTQKLASKSWRYELFYWDYVIGMLLFSLVISFTMGSMGSEGRPFLEDLALVIGIPARRRIVPRFGSYNKLYRCA